MSLTPPQQPNTLGNASLALVFGIGLHALVGALVGVGGLFGANRPRAAAMMGADSEYH